MALQQPSTYITLTNQQIEDYALCSIAPPEGTQYGDTQRRATGTPDESSGNELELPSPTAIGPANIIEADMNEEVD